MTKWQFERSEDFYKDLSMIESTGRHERENQKTHYIGLYQMGEAALVEAKYYTKDPAPGKDKPNYNNDWTGKWTGRNGINSLGDFKANREVQEIAVRASDHVQKSNFPLAPQIF